MIEIAIGWRHDNVVAGGGGFDCAADPVHERGIRRRGRLRGFRSSRLRVRWREVDEFFHAANEVALEFNVVFQAFLFQARLAFDAVVPIVGEDFVAADVNVFAGKEFKDFGQHILEEGE